MFEKALVTKRTLAGTLAEIPTRLYLRTILIIGNHLRFTLAVRYKHICRHNVVGLESALWATSAYATSLSAMWATQDEPFDILLEQLTLTPLANAR
jgi:hypothetical protein